MSKKPARTRLRPKFVIEYVLLRGIAWLVNILPYRVALGMGWGAAKLGALTMPTRMKRFERRLRTVLGSERSDREIRATLWLAWRNFCFSMIDMLRTPSLNVRRARKTFGGSRVEELMKEMKDGRGAILALPHMGSWEMAGVAVSLLGVPVFVITRDQKNPLTNAYMKRMRSQARLDAINVDSGTFVGAIRRLRKGKVLAILPDIRARTDAATVDFLGSRADIPKGMALFARVADVPILPVSIIREGWTLHRWELSDPIRPDPSLGKDEDVLRMTRHVMTCLSRAVRAHPDQYFWFNKRWVLGKE